MVFGGYADDLRTRAECDNFRLATIRQVIGQFWGCEGKRDFSVVPLGGKPRGSQRKKVSVCRGTGELLACRSSDALWPLLHVISQCMVKDVLQLRFAEEFPVHHDGRNLPSISDVLKRVALKQDKVGGLAQLHGAESVRNAKVSRRIERSGLQH